MNTLDILKDIEFLLADNIEQEEKDQYIDDNTHPDN